MLWEELTSGQHQNIARSTLVVLPIASIEQHGPALPVCVDSLISWRLCLELHQQNPDKVLILPQIKVAYSEHHMDFAGSLTVSHETLIAYICDTIEAVIFQGYFNILIFNGHGGNQAVMQVAVEKLGNKHRQVNVMATSWWKLCTADLAALQESGFMGNGHAAEFEFSLVEYLRQDLVDYPQKSLGAIAKIPLEQAKGDLLQGGSVSLLRTFREMTEDGTYGLTAKASKEKGKVIFLAALQGFETLLLNICALPRR